VEKYEPWGSAGGKIKWYTHFGKPSVPQTIRHKVPLWSSVLLGVYPKEVKISAQMFISTLFVMVKKRNNPNGHNWWTDKMWPIHTMKYYLAMKKNEALVHAKYGRTLKTLC
jgi:hypothetical protein